MLKYTNTDAVLNVFFREKRNQYRRQRDKKKKARRNEYRSNQK